MHLDMRQDIVTEDKIVKNAENKRQNEITLKLLKLIKNFSYSEIIFASDSACEAAATFSLQKEYSQLLEDKEP